MLLGIAYELPGDQAQQVTIGIRAQMAWEKRTGSKIGDLAEGISTTAMMGLLFQQLEIDGALPDGVRSDLDLAERIADVNPAELAKATPTHADPAPES